jgi:ribosome-associated protein
VVKLRKTPSLSARRRTPRQRPIPTPDRPRGGGSTPAHIAEASRKIALLAAQAGLDKKASGVEIIDVTGKVDYADYLVLMTGHSDRHVNAIAQSVDEFLSQNGHRAISVEGMTRGQWVLIDLVDVVVHVFLQEARSLYDLDGLWMDAGRIPVPEFDATPPGLAEPTRPAPRRSREP